ncbi:AraC family transcriptional regulator [uncultured Chitinophaga sp.]|uniref:helix-turn-helix domain-containing protein n=1 Tax=uncultured Chitinophaga sp. TaxID=339340 RepID=UPI0025D64CD6|nr:helix-turn-helix domain-containing protein [uncultured Chitinophaga sp.]
MQIHTETIQGYYERIGLPVPAGLPAGGSHFNIRQRTYIPRLLPFNRRDYYKICLGVGNMMHATPTRTISIEQPSIIFSCPSLPTQIQAQSEDQKGYTCIFNDAFLLNGLKQEVRFESPLFNDSLEAVYPLDAAGVERFTRYFTEMETLMASDYAHKYDMLRHLLVTVIHEGIRLRGPLEEKNQGGDRLTTRFFHLMDQQFPVDSPESPLKMMTPADYATSLNIHVNHLNASVKKATGKTTREVIHERIIAEAKVLLLNTDWDAAEIAYALGFEYPSHFNKYFRQYAQTTPLLFRESARPGVMANI